MSNVPEPSHPVKNRDHPVCALCASRVGPLERLSDGTIVCLSQAYCRRLRAALQAANDKAARQAQHLRALHAGEMVPAQTHLPAQGGMPA